MQGQACEIFTSIFQTVWVVLHYNQVKNVYYSLIQFVHDCKRLKGKNGAMLLKAVVHLSYPCAELYNNN